VYAATTNPEEVDWIRAILQKLGAEVFSLRWDFDGPDWVNTFLNKITTETRSSYKEAMRTRAEELTRFTKKEVEKLDDKMMEKVVANYFGVAELATGQWAALKGPTKIKLAKCSDAVSCAGASEAFSLLQISNTVEVAAASVIFQELTTKMRKGEEYQVRNDLFTISMDPFINNQDAGVAFLKGFDLPRYKMELKKEIKETKTPLTFPKHWDEWLRQMRGAVAMFIDNLVETLKVDRKTNGLMQFSSDATEETVNVA
jgi:hypothetical protein